MIEPGEVRAVVATATQRLRAAGIPAAAAESRWLVSELLGTSPAGLLFAEPVSAAQAQQIEEAVCRRERREPLQHILGSAPFADLELAVGPGVFIPRPETELLAQAAIHRAQGRGDAAASGVVTVVDACSGSGAVALTVACQLTCRVVAIERSPQALDYLRRNVAELRPRFAARGSTVDVVAGDVTVAAGWPAAGSVDVVVANPPYIPQGCIPRDPEVRDHDPAVALFGGVDGMSVTRPLIGHAAAVLASGGHLLIEHADDQGDLVPELVERSGSFSDIVDHRDLSGRPRFTTAVRVRR